VSMIEVADLARSFGQVEAVKGVSFDVGENEIFGFLGPNGAGKTTTINMLCTLLRPSAGRVTVDGIDTGRDPAGVRRSIGMIFQDPSLDEQLTGRENLRFHAMLYAQPEALFQRRSAEVLEMVELDDKADVLVRTYSGGMKRRLEIARGLLHHPRVLFLDEPTIGLDPQTRRLIWDYLTRLRQSESVTLFMTTHYMEEAEHCDRIAVIDHGEIVALDTPGALKGRVGGDLVTVRTSDNALASRKLRQSEALESRPGPNGQLIIEVEQGDHFIPRMMALFANGGRPVEVSSVNLRRPTLEDVFIKLTGHAIRDEEAPAHDHLRLQRRMRRH
jgi:ABC-2 type transport system ATP-binding protein